MATQYSVSGGAEPTDTDFAEWAASEELARESLDRLRQTAEGWRNALSLGSGVLGGAALIASTVATARGEVPDWVIYLATLAALLIAVSVFLAARATAGWPRRSTPNERVAVWRAVESGKTLWSFRWSVWLAVLGGVLAIAATAGGVLSDNSSQVILDLRSGATVCIDSAEAIGQQWYRVVTEGRTKLVARDDVVSFAPGKC